MNVDTAKLRQFINDHFGPEDLRTFLFDYFRSVYDDLTDGLTKSKQISLLLEYCHKHKKFPDLLAAIERERSFFQADDYVQGETVPTAAPQPPVSTTRNPHQFFISHTHEDAETAQRLANDLRSFGCKIWMAPDSIQPGEKWAEAIGRGLEESGVFLLLLSPEAIASSWVRTETNAAIELNHNGEMRLFPLLLRNCKVPILLRTYQHISLQDGYKQGFSRLWQILYPPVDVPSWVFDPAVNKPLSGELQVWVHPKSGLEMIRIPAGEFLYGDEKRKQYLDEFWIAKTPVTNAEYKRFLDANSDYDVPYRNEDWAKKYNWDRQRRTFPEGKANHPAVLVSWHDAKAYADWAGLKLPTEQQWEKAARGTDGREYPWGDDWRENYCNTSEAGLGTTSPVGRFSPQGDSAFGCVDMAGNVWEWTDSKWKPGSTGWALRGGSWYLNQLNARVAKRDGRNPDVAFKDIGFRLVAPSVSPIEE